jgi:hypothetical protein
MLKEGDLKSLYKSEKLVPINGSMSNLATKKWLVNELYDSLKQYHHFTETKIDLIRKDCQPNTENPLKPTLSTVIVKHSP